VFWLFTCCSSKGRAGAAKTNDPYRSVNEYYDANADTIAPRSRNIAASDINDQQIENAINGFSETSQALVKGLTALGQVHPFIGGMPNVFGSKRSLMLDSFDKLPSERSFWLSRWI
jgi:hypothetical protein